jgi:hypothetical protein
MTRPNSALKKTQAASVGAPATEEVEEESEDPNKQPQEEEKEEGH